MKWYILCNYTGNYTDTIVYSIRMFIVSCQYDSVTFVIIEESCQYDLVTSVIIEESCQYDLVTSVIIEESCLEELLEIVKSVLGTSPPPP